MTERATLDPDLVRFYMDTPTPLVSDCLHRLPGTQALRSFGARASLAGRAYTVRTRPGDNLYVHLALDLAQPGDIIVVAADGDTSNAIVGEIMKRYAQSRGIGGFVIDGAIRDVAAFRQDDFPCFARGAQHRGPYKDGPGQLGCDVSIGGMLVRHGDLIVGDEDGLIALDPQQAQALRAKVQAQADKERGIMRDIDAGTFDRSWLKPLRDSLGL